jgi:uncharacterized membrane protein
LHEEKLKDGWNQGFGATAYHQNQIIRGIKAIAESALTVSWMLITNSHLFVPSLWGCALETMPLLLVVTGLLNKSLRRQSE